MIDKIKRAEEIAREVHKGQKRTIGKREDYIEHPKRVASHFSTPESQIIAWLHDVLEDTSYTEQDLLNEGINPFVVSIVARLSKKPNENYLGFILRISKDLRAITIKTEDIKDNMKSLKEGSLLDKYCLALYILELTVGDNYEKWEKWDKIPDGVSLGSRD